MLRATPAGDQDVDAVEATDDVGERAPERVGVENHGVGRVTVRCDEGLLERPDDARRCTGALEERRDGRVLRRPRLHDHQNELHVSHRTTTPGAHGKRPDASAGKVTSGMSTDLGPGVVVAGRYRLDRLLGRGGMGQVWAVTHEVTHRVAALKLLNGPSHLQEGRRRRFLREARAASAVQHPNVVAVHDFFELPDGTPVMIMDLLEGETLGSKLAREGALPLDVAAAILLPVVSAVGTAHARGVIHRDLKPENVFLCPAGDVRVLDFGVAKLVGAALPPGDDSDGLTGGGVVGTPSYMSPEQGFGEGSLDHRSDVWSLGVVLYEVLSGVRPVDGANVGQVLKRLMNEAITPIAVLVPELRADVCGARRSDAPARRGGASLRSTRGRCRALALHERRGASVCRRRRGSAASSRLESDERPELAARSAAGGARRACGYGSGH